MKKYKKYVCTRSDITVGALIILVGALTSLVGALTQKKWQERRTSLFCAPCNKKIRESKKKERLSKNFYELKKKKQKRSF